MLVENLPFRVIRVSDQNDLNKVAQLRHEAYARHLPQFAQTLASPEPADYDNDNLVLLAVAKDDGAPLATMRIHTNRKKPLPIEHAVTLPEAMHSATLAEAVRFSVTNFAQAGGGSLPRDALFKAYYLACVNLNIEWMVIGARNPLHKLYLGLLFNDISPNGEPVALPYADNIPHRVLRLRVHDVKSLWDEKKHTLYPFIFNTHHPDLEIR